MNKKNLIYVLIILSIVIVLAGEANTEKDTLDYFQRRGFVKTSYILLQNETIRPIEKAQIISEICTRLFFYDQQTDIDAVRLYSLYKMVQKYRLEITTVDLIDVDGAIKKLKHIIDNSGSLNQGYKFDNKKGVSAYELEKRVLNKDIKEKKPLLKKYTPYEAWYYDLKGISYFQANMTLYRPSTDLSYVADDELMFSAAFGYYIKIDTAFELRRFYYSYYERRNYFGNTVSRYGTRVEPLSFTLKKDYFQGKVHKLYFGYGLTRMKTEHIAESNRREKVEDSYICPHILWGTDVYSRKKYALNFEMLYFINANGSMNVRGIDYNINTDDVLMFFGMKFYFSDK